MQFNVKLKLEDLIALQKNYLRTATKGGIRSKNVILICILVLFVLSFFFFPTVNPVINAYKIVLITLFGVLMPALLEKKQIRKLKKSNYSRQLQPLLLIMNEAGIQIQREGRSAQDIPWEDIVLVTTDAERYFLYQSNYKAIIIPKSILTEETNPIKIIEKYAEKAKVTIKPAIRPKRNPIIVSLSIGLILILGLHFFSPLGKNNVNTAMQKVHDLFEEKEEGSQTGESSKIKKSTDQNKIDEAQQAVNKIKTSKNGMGENDLVAMGLQASIVVAQTQLDNREGKPDPAQEREQETDSFTPKKTDIVYKEGEITNKDKLEAFIDDAEHHVESEIRVVKYEERDGIMMYNLESRYDENAEVGWLYVRPDKSHYTYEGQEIFNNQFQQCGSISRNEAEGYYQLHECRTHWAFNLIPIEDD